MTKISSAVATFIFIFSKQAMAWEPCLPFCDAGCSGAAMSRLASDTVSSINQYKIECTELTKSLASSSTEFADLTADMTEALFSNHTDAITALDGFVGKITLSTTQSAKFHEANANTITNTFVKNIKDLSKVKSFINSHERYGELGQYSHPYLFKASCPDCALEPVHVLSDLESKLAKTKSKLALITFESSGESSNSVLKNRVQHDWLTTNFAASSLSPVEVARMQGIFIKESSDSNPRYKAIRKLKSVVVANRITETSNSNVEGYSKLNLSTYLKGTTFDTLLRGHEANSISDDMSAVMKQNDHALLIRQALSQNAINTNLNKLNEVGRQRNILLAIKLITKSDE
ncbi:hypothetical protein HHX48_17810 [Salinimonas sp. HHU 13199]|uniref:Uncharacterized protein n=1 Tax=Salinimonas profundi TaxID=2729140 RepID=A0ABR8LN25_9ALTE|nr:hypothetical protein [Salinimonas profundi]MBD3587598.1 hypothetical protein [Salinimonas profundi]